MELDPMDIAVDRKLTLLKIASRWYMKYHTTELSFDELKDFMDMLNFYNVTSDERKEIDLKMAHLYIGYLEDRIEDLEEK